eukprot:scaffold7505_cov146-Cylindrotheca_fusiformis.AAC.1
MSNSYPPWEAYRAFKAGRLIALDKQPGVRPIGVGDIFFRLFAKVLLKSCASSATQACGADQLCAGLRGGVEGAVHAALSARGDILIRNMFSNGSETIIDVSLVHVDAPSHLRAEPLNVLRTHEKTKKQEEIPKGLPSAASLFCSFCGVYGWAPWTRSSDVCEEACG